MADKSVAAMSRMPIPIFKALLTAAILLAMTACSRAGNPDFPALKSGMEEELGLEQPLQVDFPASSSTQEDGPENGMASQVSIGQPEPGKSTPAPAASNGQRQDQSGDEAESWRIKLSFGGNEAYATLYDTSPGRDLLSRLPLTLEFQDYVGTEKIAYLDQTLTNETDSNAPSTGDFAYYAPWGNLAVFYNDIPWAGGGLVILGSMESGKELLAGMTENFTMTMELTN